MLDRELFGMNAAGYHWTNVILHLLGGLILFLALSRMTASPWRSGLVAALFLIHPLHVESVAWVAERKDVLSGLFWMMGLWCYARYAERPGLVRYLWVVLSFTCGLLSKPMVVTFPFVLLLLDWWPLGRTVGGKASWARLVWEKIPLFLLSAAASVITFLVQKESHAIVPLSAMPLGDRLANAAVSYAAYLGKTFWPAGLSIFYPYHGPPPFGHLVSAIALLILITVISVLLFEPPALSARRLALVSGDTGSGHRPRAGRFAGDGGPLYLPAAGRRLHHGGVGRQGSPGRLSGAKGDLGFRFGSSDGHPGLS